MKHPTTEEEFRELMEEIENRFQADNVPVAHRPLRALELIASEFKLVLPLTSPDLKPTPGVFCDDSMSAHIYHWYKDRYGTKLADPYFTLGVAAIMIRNIPWKMWFGRCFGCVKLVCNADLGRAVEQIPSTRSFAVYNVLKSLEGLTADFARSLSQEEREGILAFYSSTQRTLEALKFHITAPFIREAIGDLKACVEQLMNGNYGLSVWSSQQFTEKLAKGLLREKKQPVRYTHDLREIFRLGEKLGLAAISPELIEKVICNADIRYNEQHATMNQAITAHHSSLKIAEILLSG
jgi:HEPN domain-containing protein